VLLQEADMEDVMEAGTLRQLHAVGNPADALQHVKRAMHSVTLACSWPACLETVLCSGEGVARPMRRRQTPHPNGWHRSISSTTVELG
jgi:hypothetical protein